MNDRLAIKPGVYKELIGNSEGEEEALRESEDRLKIILESVQTGIVIIDSKTHRIIDANSVAVKLIGALKEQIVGSVCHRYICSAEKGQCPITDLGQSVDNSERVLLTARGEKCPVIKTVVPVILGGRKHLLESFIDITERKQAEEALRKEKETAQKYLDIAGVILLVINAGQKVTLVNRRGCEILGYKEEEIIGKNWFDNFLPERIRNEVKPIFLKLMAGEIEPVEYFENTVLNKRGEERIIAWHNTVITVENGNIAGTLSSGEDITERKQAEEALRESESRFRLLVEHSTDAFLLHDFDGRIIDVNQHSCESLGYTREELLGLSIQDIDQAFVPGKHAEEWKQMIPGVPITLEGVHKRKDGTTFPVEVRLGAFELNGRKLMLGLVRDITERKRTEVALKKSEEKYRTILENIEDAYYEVDLAGNLIFFNDSMCRICGYPKEELMGMNNRQYTDQENAKKLFQAFNKVYRTGGPGRECDWEIIRKDGTKRCIEASISLQKDSIHKPIGFRGIIRDVTDRKQAEEALKRNHEQLLEKNREIEASRTNLQLALEELERAYKELKTTQSKILQQEKMASIGQLAAGVAHEINNPMAFISSNLGTLGKYVHRLTEFIQTQSEVIESLNTSDAVEGLKRKQKELKLDYITEDIKGLITESLDGSERVQKIVQGLKSFARVDEAEYKYANINECIENTLNIVWNELKYKATLKKDYGNIPLTKCYPQQMNQVFMNLLINAIHSIEKQGEIAIKTRDEDGSIIIAISDTGGGIPQENLNKIFEPFFTTKEVGKGTGLGLSITYEIVQRHNGEITVESEVGKGTTFTIRLPIA